MTDEFVDNGELVVLGVVQEQHAKRAELYAQWRQLQWPILYDPINKLGLEAVPVPVAIDENGIVRKVRMKNKDQFRSDFIENDFSETTARAPRIDKSKLNTDWIQLLASA